MCRTCDFRTASGARDRPRPSLQKSAAAQRSVDLENPLAPRHADNDIDVRPSVLSVRRVHPEPVRNEGQHVGLDADLLVERLPDAVAA